MRQNGKDQEVPEPSHPLDELFLVKPGDVLELWMEGSRVVRTLIECREELAGNAYQWVWMFLDDGSLIEASPDGFFRYREHQILRQGTAHYEEIVAQDGALVRFEERVREGSSAERPVAFTYDDRTYQITSTGTVYTRTSGDEPDLLTWKSFSEKPAENVYFGLADADDETRVGVGLWTAHVCLSFGKALEPADLSEVYRK
ncbi:MAG: hypothetical protein A3F84_16815 [Candidatus Handelsmanbacteria bacterium RIFCSPLOWO2_12_FULL_64_10]|uniref:DUF4178 domain-containing protein n=1 Tax=Handelsmanbacteria sp. (strain RIFCSPLOWO2_12_FULL_64_10) TaxID=1817868 RepID=A0A1F6CKI6_HANXR|nr:MAG: hypothetical protein A3F84_16815 [Candidatus Handelsmanbacteria bacterium RIFCSPLOWO2_12_FULL_64_10]